jgi:hypothetical protein
MTHVLRRAIAIAFAAAGLVLCIASARAQAATPSYAIVTLLADRIYLVTHQMGTGSHLDTNRRQEFALPDDALDGVAAFAADDAIKKMQPGARTELFTTRDAAMIALQDKAADGPDLPQELLEGVKTLVAKANAERLVVITRQRDETRIRFHDGSLGSGTLSGVGFYLDPQTRVHHLDSGLMATGFVAPYAYVKVNVYDLASLKPIAGARAKASDVVTAAGSDTAVIAWNAMSGTQKFDALKAVVREAVADAIPKVIH